MGRAWPAGFGPHRVVGRGDVAAVSVKGGGKGGVGVVELCAGTEGSEELRTMPNGTPRLLTGAPHLLLDS